jgi:hypothetical protein
MQPAAVGSAVIRVDEFDVVIAGDMICWGDQGFRVTQEIRHYARDGKRVALVQAVELSAGRRIAPEIQTCVGRKLATVADPAAIAATELLVLHSPSTVAWTARPLGRIRSAKTVLVCHRSQDFGVKRIRQRLRGGAEQSMGARDCAAGTVADAG